MNMVTITTHMSMQFRITQIAELISCEDIEFVVGVGCRGMLAGPPLAAAGGMHGSADVARGEEPLPSRGFTGRAEAAGLANGAGTSSSRGRTVAKYGEGGSSSDAD